MNNVKLRSAGVWA